MSNESTVHQLVQAHTMYIHTYVCKSMFVCMLIGKYHKECANMYASLV